MVFFDLILLGEGLALLLKWVQLPPTKQSGIYTMIKYWSHRPQSAVGQWAVGPECFTKGVPTGVQPPPYEGL